MSESSRKQVPSETASETSLLLGGPRPSGWRSRSVSREQFRLSPETLLIPVALAARLAAMITQTTFIEVLRLAVCRLWNISHGDPPNQPAGGSLPPGACDAADIARYFSILVAALAVTEGVMVTVECSILNRVSSRYGRKPAFFFVLAAGFIGNSLLPLSQYVPDWISDWVFLSGMLATFFSGTIPCVYLTNIYVVDVCLPNDRTAALSKIAGWGTLGTCISFFLGGSITTKTGNPLIVFYIAAALFASTFIYVVWALPESFSKEKRDALSHMRQESSSDGLPQVTVFSSFSLLLEPLKMLAPVRRLDGTRNWRLAWCGLHTLLFMTASVYTPTGWLVIATSIYHLTPAQTGLFLTVATISGTIALAVIVPLLVPLLHPYYIRRTTHPPLEEEDSNEGEEPEPETSDHLDVHLAFASCVLVGVFFLCAAASTTYQALIFSAICIGFAYIHTPTIRSLVAGSVDPLKQGEALAAIEMVAGIGTVLSPIIMGSILTATINTVPLLMFYVHLVVVLISGGILFLVRDSDRYRESDQMQIGHLSDR